jgi:choline kinase
MKAVILAAGMGTRLRPMTKKMPKCLIEIDGKSLIEYSLKALKFNGIKEVFIIVGFYGELIKQRLGNDYDGINIMYIENKEYTNTGSMYSFSKLKNAANDDILLLESDLIYDKKAIKEILASKQKDVILIADLLNSGDDVYVCSDKDNMIINLGKKISEEDKKNAAGALVGISKLSKEFILKLFKKAEEDYKKDKKNKHYEEVIFELTKLGYKIYVKLCKDLNWIEIDNEYDLKRAKQDVYIKLKDNQNEAS